ncbi:hypothetical protein A7982_13639 [Minicystis rosea]|nr:hypothetical protein A7982_13639 [Minicystis rosea]
MSFSTAVSRSLSETFLSREPALASCTRSEAGALLASWIPRCPEAMMLLPFALTDDAWAAARAVVDPCVDLKNAILPFGLSIMGLEAVPRLVEAHASKQITKHARFVYRLAIVGALAVEASRDVSWPKEYDEYLRFDPAAWWFAKTPYMYGYYHLYLQLETWVSPLLQIAIAKLPAPRAHEILDEALDTQLPKGFPMAFFALPCLRAHWRPEYVAKAGRAIAWYQAKPKGSDGNERSTKVLIADARALGVYEQVIIEVFRHGDWDDLRWLHFPDRRRFLATAKQALPPESYARLAARVRA